MTVTNIIWKVNRKNRMKRPKRMNTKVFNINTIANIGFKLLIIRCFSGKYRSLRTKYRELKRKYKELLNKTNETADVSVVDRLIDWKATIIQLWLLKFINNLPARFSGWAVRRNWSKDERSWTCIHQNDVVTVIIGFGPKPLQKTF